MQREENILVEECRRGNSQARRELYDLHAKRLYAICVRYVGDKEVAEDLLHDSILKIFSSMDRFTWRGKGSLQAWMDRITVNLAIEHLRKKSRISEIPLNENWQQSDDAYSDMDSGGDIPLDVLMRMISELPDGYRTVFNLFCVEGHSHNEIASMLGINEKSSSSQLVRARSLLASKVKHYTKSK